MKRHLLTLLATALVVGACSDSSVRETSTSFSFLEQVRATGEVSLEKDGVTVEVASDVDYASENIVQDTLQGRSGWHATLNGHDLQIDGKSLRIGDVDYGPTVRGDRVHISSAGVLVNDERRGDAPLPPE